MFVCPFLLLSFSSSFSILLVLLFFCLLLHCAVLLLPLQLQTSKKTKNEMKRKQQDALEQKEGGEVIASSVLFKKAKSEVNDENDFFPLLQLPDLVLSHLIVKYEKFH